MCWPTNHIRPTSDTQPRTCQARIEGMPNHQVEGSFGSPDAVLPITAPGPAARVNEDRERPGLRCEAADQAEDEGLEERGCRSCSREAERCGGRMTLAVDTGTAGGAACTWAVVLGRPPMCYRREPDRVRQWETPRVSFVDRGFSVSNALVRGGAVAAALGLLYILTF